MFTGNLSPLRPSKFSFEYLLLTPRSAPTAAQTELTFAPSGQPSRPPTHWSIAFTSMVWFRGLAWAPSIFGASWFGRWVVTHSLAGSDFHGHRPAVYINQHPLWYRNERALWPLNQTSGASHIASSAYQKWPTKRADSMRHFTKESTASHPFKV